MMNVRKSLDTAPDDNVQNLSHFQDCRLGEASTIGISEFEAWGERLHSH
jgi:hypothetical protein